MIVLDVLTNKCPRCRKGRVYKSNNLASFGHVEMHTSCPICGLDYTKDPGFFWGSMYVSYALAIIAAGIGYTICRLLGTGKFDIINLVVAVGAILVSSPLNFRLARLIWLYIFPKS